MRQKSPESGVLRACLDLLAAERIWHERRNTGAMRDGKRIVRFSRNGTADIFATPCGLDRNSRFWHYKPHPLWIECKSDSGKQSEAQKAFQAEVEAAGHYYLLVRRPEDLKTWLREHGAIK